MRIPLIGAAAAALALTASLSQATVISTAYTALGANAWLVDFTITNDGTPASFAGFTIDIPNATNLVLRTSPATWDSAVFQPDASLPDAGFLDSFIRSPSNALLAGQSIGGFGVSFTHSPGGAPGPLPFMVYSANFTPLFSGITTVSPIPEPPTVFLAALGLALVGLRARKRLARSRKLAEGAAA